MSLLRSFSCELMAGWLALATVVGAPLAWAADWPEWGGNDAHTLASPERSLPASFEPGKKHSDGSGIDQATTKNVAWTARLGTENYSSPVVAGGRVFIGTNDSSLNDSRLAPTKGGLLQCLDAATGRLEWQLPVPKLEIDRSQVSESFDDMSLGICGTPTVDGDRVYVVTNRDEVLCLDVRGLSNGNDGPFRDEAQALVPHGRPAPPLRSTDADILWRFDMIRQLPVFPHDAADSSVLVRGDFLYVGTGNGTSDTKVMLPAAPSLIALDKRTGQLVARDDGKISPGVFHGQWSSPTLGMVDGRPLILYGGGDGVCYAFAALDRAPRQVATLPCVWSFDCNPPSYRFRDGQRIDYWQGDKRKNKANKNDGQYVGPSEIIATPVFYKNRVYVAIGQDPLHGRGRGALQCIDATQRGDISQRGAVWTYTGIERSLSSVAIADGLVFAPDLSGKIHCLDAETGRVYWVHDTKQDIWASPLVADGKLYIGTRKALWVLAAAKTEKVLAEIRLGSQVRSAPAAANGALYVASQRYLWAVRQKPATLLAVGADGQEPNHPKPVSVGNVP